MPGVQGNSRTSNYFSPTQSDRYIGFELSIGDYQIPTYQYLQDFSFSFGADSDWKGHITLFDPDWDFLESLIIRTQEQSPGKVKESGFFSKLFKNNNNEGHGRISFSFGWNDQLAGPYDAAILAYAPSFSHDGVTLELNLCHPTTVTRNAEVWTGSWPPNTPASQIVLDLLPQLGRYIKGYVIEPSTPYTSGPIIMPKQHPASWIKKQFCGLDADKPALSAVRTGAGGYEFSIDNNGILRFHTPGYKGSIVPTKAGATKSLTESRGVVRRYNFAKGVMGQVLSFSVGDLSKYCQILGSGASSGNTVDSKRKGNRRSAASIDGRSNSYAPTRYADSKKTAGIGARSGRMTHHDPRPYRDKKALDDMVQARFNILTESVYTADLEILGDPFINYNDYIEVTVLKKDGQRHYTSGVYLVTRVEHKISMGEFTTALALKKSSAETAAASFDKVKPNIRKGSALANLHSGQRLTKYQNAVNQPRG